MCKDEKRFCDVCGEEIKIGDFIALNPRNDLEEVCKKCYDAAKEDK